ncbi:hypothetical protein J1605_016955 [Eschrichtius robustus]|uniref:Uncharacterized protein n=1 Tax=Eschrichtius robustus TaxID=9764 RepID=A0AB34I347_ESCRO|nr:hypothetical protein J1605_016955 [Eschrichtius robustus]
MSIVFSGCIPVAASVRASQLSMAEGRKKENEKKGMLPVTLVTACDENERVGSGVGRATPCEFLGLLPASVEAQQVPVTYSRRESCIQSASTWQQVSGLQTFACLRARKKLNERKRMLPANLVTACDENERVGSGAGRATPCEALGLLPVSVDAQQVPVNYPRRGSHLSVWAKDPVLVQSSCGQPFILRAMLSQTAPGASTWQRMCGLHTFAWLSAGKCTNEKKVTLPATLVTDGDENQRLGSGAGSAVPCEALGLLALSVEAQQFPLTYSRSGFQLSV